MFDTKKQAPWAALKVGTVITLAFLVLFLTVFFAGGIEDLLSPKSEIKAKVQHVKGLRRGAPVWLSGIEVGTVEEITLNPSFGTIVTLSIRRSALEYVNKDAQAGVFTMGLLGDKYVELSTGSPKAGRIRPGDTIEGISQLELKDVMDTSAASIERLNEFIKKLDVLVTKINEGEGTVAKFIRDPGLYNSLNEAALALSSTAKDIRDSRGSLGLLIGDPTLYERISSAAGSFESFSRKLADASGTIGRLAEDPALYERLLSAAASIDDFSRKLNEGSGTLKKMTEDPALYDNLNRAAGRLSSVLEKIDRGEGVAGSLITDQELARDLREIVTEVRALARDIRENPKRYLRFSLF